MRKLSWGVAFLVMIAVLAGVGFWLRPLAYFNGLLYFQMAASGARSQYVTVKGHSIHYYVRGPESGYPVVLVHGLGGRAEDWRNLLPYLAAAGFRVYAPDLIGYGRSEKPADSTYSIPEEAAVVIGFMDALELKQVDLGGWSMGGWIVQEIAAEHAGRVNRLMLFDSAGIREAPSWDTKLFTPANEDDLNQLDALLMPHPQRIPHFIALDILRTSRENAWVIHRALNAMLAGTDVTDDLLPTLKMPVLIVWGTMDQITPLAQAEKIHRAIPQSRLEVFEGCGHLAPAQCADLIAPKTIAFLR